MRKIKLGEGGEEGREEREGGRGRRERERGGRRGREIQESCRRSSTPTSSASSLAIMSNGKLGRISNKHGESY